MKYHIFFLTIYSIGVLETSGHGMMMDPPNRSSLWRFDPTAPKNYDDNQNWCGGFWVQYSVNGGKCGVCGDNFQDSVPRANENTGKYGGSVVTGKYRTGEVIKVDILVTANHKGYFNYSLCILEDPSKPETDDCFIPLKFANGDVKFNIDPDAHAVENHIQLPPGLTCQRCVLRWHYHTGNTWGKCEDGSSAVGCGPQETFRSCSDISIQ